MKTNKIYIKNYIKMIPSHSEIFLKDVAKAISDRNFKEVLLLEKEK